MRKTFRTLAIDYVILIFIGCIVSGSEWYVSTSGNKQSSGSRESPWDIESALNGSQKNIKPGDSIIVLEGIYKATPSVGSMGFVIKLTGSEDSPVKVIAEKGKRVTMTAALISSLRRRISG